MFQKISKELVELTPKKAERFLSFNVFAAQRSINHKWVSGLANNIRDELFTTGHIVLAEYQNGEESQTYLLNGQHQCNSVLVANKKIDVVLDRYLCPSMDDVSLLYRQVNNAKVSTLQDLVKMEADSLGVDWSLRVASLVVSAAAMKDGLTNAHKNVKVELLKEYLRRGLFVNQILGDAKSSHIKHLMRSPVVCAMLTTHEKCQRDSEIFWVNVRDGEGLLRTMPEFKLREFLKESNFDRGRGAVGSNRRTVNQHEMISRCITAWNVFRKKKKCHIIKYYPTKPIPKAI